MAPNAPWVSMAWANLGVCLRRAQDRDGAEHCFKEALKFGKSAIAYSNLSATMINQARPRECLEIVERALALEPDYPAALTNKAIAHLELGEFEQGWKHYDSRLDSDSQYSRRNYSCSEWDGGYTDCLVVHGEQGIGDEILFGSLIERVKPLVGKLVLECHKKLVKTYERSFEVPCYGTEQELKESPTAWIAVGSLPRIFKVYEPIHHRGYLKPNDERVRLWRQFYPGPRIGVSWRGGTDKTDEALRNFPVEIWKKLTSTRQMISLQYDNWEGEAQALGLRIPDIANFDDHMALVKSCDLVISICNTTVHMAGSMGVPCWCLVPSKPAWRYGLEGEKMFWYDSVKLYRQTVGWEEVIDRIVGDLSA